MKKSNKIVLLIIFITTISMFLTGLSLLVDDGFITVSLIHKFNRLFTIHNLIKLNKKGAGSIKYNERFKCEKILVKLDKKFYDIDGELYNDTDELSVRIVHNTLKFII